MTLAQDPMVVDQVQPNWVRQAEIGGGLVVQPVAPAAPLGFAAATAEFFGYDPTRATSAEHEDDCVERGAVRHPRMTAVRLGRFFTQQGIDGVPRSSGTRDSLIPAMRQTPSAGSAIATDLPIKIAKADRF